MNDFHLAEELPLWGDECAGCPLKKSHFLAEQFPSCWSVPNAPLSFMDGIFVSAQDEIRAPFMHKLFPQQ